MKSLFNIASGTKKVLVIVISITVLIIVSAYFYYRELNRSVDPRILAGRSGLSLFNELIKKSKFDKALLVIEDVERIYLNVPGYQDTFELGVVYNNLASVYLLRVENEYLRQQEKGLKIGTPDELKLYLEQARIYLKKAIDKYQKWLDKAKNMGRFDFERLVIPYFSQDDPVFLGLDIEAIVEQRVNDLLLSKEETKRRLSVSYTNLGVINRYRGKPKEAESNYKLAMGLWSENNVAKNNLNMLYGRPREERSIIQKLFPPERKKNSP